MRMLLLFTTVAGLLSAQPLTRGERDRAMSHMHATRKLFLDSVDGVSPQQWAWKPAPEVWSVAEVSEHIAVSEDSLFELVTRKILTSPADPSKKAEAAGRDEFLMKSMVDRSRKAQAPEMLRPTNRWKTKDELVAHFKQSRDRNIAYVENTQDELRSHFTPHPAYKLVDAYQWLLLTSAHSERHILQLNEVKTLPGYPKN
ncbi:MAG: DinB family protein [Acidobacteria bacterium]|nr:DinB family protein [Acidobacteriota bacterium]